MAAHTEAVGKSGDELSAEDRICLSELICPKYCECINPDKTCIHQEYPWRRFAWRIMASVDQTKTSKGNKENMLHSRRKIADGVRHRRICLKILAVLENRLIEKATTGESKVLYQTMKADCYRYIAEYTIGDDKTKVAK